MKALLVVDVQKAFFNEKWGERNNHDAEEKMATIIDYWRKQGEEVIFIQHLSNNPQSVFYHKQEGFVIKESVKPMRGEQIFTKTVNSAFIGTGLEEYLHDRKISEVVIVGLTTPHCVSTTARMSGNLGFHTSVVSDAMAAYGIYDQDENYVDPETVHSVSLATIHEEFATVMTTDQLLTRFVEKK
ncbi:cysteine hydrolase family protein [Alkalihalobacillus sp. CinArs1]|uniref:cysteine hydrolase family protein n=1 Tax=Alkalihalobacillus sp. CinArs1 TaxID=2995314 RepID=UPI0022DDE67B|nr:cysteine hydrolase family protein [Alkalihalobacillus sp. CinArs1]